MADVARLAGVSHQTVSRVINGSDQVRQDTRERVEQAIRQLGYRPNSAARALVTGRSATIGVIGSETGSAARRQPCTASSRRPIRRATSSARQPPGSRCGPRCWTRSSTSGVQGVEGIVVIAPPTDAAHRSRSSPTTSRWSSSRATGPTRASRSSPATRSPALRSRRGTCSSSATARSCTSRARRLDRGRSARLRLAIDTRGRRRDPFQPRSSATGARRQRYEAGRRLAADAEVTAVFVANDQMALGVLRALHEAGRGMPSGVSVVGFDDIPEAAYLIPPLTTVRQDFTEVGSRAIQLLLDAIESGAADCADHRPQS